MEPVQQVIQQMVRNVSCLQQGQSPTNRKVCDMRYTSHVKWCKHPVTDACSLFCPIDESKKQQQVKVFGSYQLGPRQYVGYNIFAVSKEI